MPRFFGPYEETEPDEMIPPGWNRPIPSNPDWPSVPGQDVPPLIRQPYSGPTQHEFTWPEKPYKGPQGPIKEASLLADTPALSGLQNISDQQQVPLPKPDPRGWYGEDAQFPVGRLPGRLYTLPQFNNLGRIRPFGPGEYIDTRGQNLPGNPSWDSEESVTIQRPDGKWTVIPGLWIVDGQAHHVTEDQALQYATQSGLIYPTFDTQQQAEKFTADRENKWQGIPFGRSDMLPPLWSRPLPGGR